MRLALVALCVLALAACGGGTPKRKLRAGTLVVGSVVVSQRDRLIARGARIAVGEVENAGGIEGRVRLRLITGADARVLVRRGARALILPCEAGDELRALRGLRADVLKLATCEDAVPRGSTAPWGVGPSLADRADMLVAELHRRDVQRVRIEPPDAGLPRAAKAWGIQVVERGGDAVVTDGGWATATALGRPAYGLDRLDTARGVRTAGPAAEGTVFATFGFPVPGTKLDELYERYRLAYGARPDGSVVVLGYDAVRVVTEATEEARSTEPRALAAALPGLEVGGSGGVLNYERDGSHQPRADVALVEVRAGRLELLRRGRPERP